MKSKKLIIAISVAILCVMLFTLAGCNKKLDNATALADLTTALEASRNSDSYYTEYNDKTVNKTYKLNVASANSEDSMIVQYSVETDMTTTVAYTHLYYKDGSLIYSNPDYVKKDKKDTTPMEKKNYDYLSKTLNKEGLFTSDIIVKEKSGDAIYNLSAYTDDAFFALLDNLTADNTTVESYTQNNIVRLITLKVTDESHFLSKYKSVAVRLINNKVYQIADSAGTFVFNITYVGPKISFPDADRVTAE